MKRYFHNRIIPPMFILIFFVVYGFNAGKACARTYSTSFPLTENPISEGGVWINGGVTGLDWKDARTTPGKVFGTQTGSSGTYDDTTAVLNGTWGPNQDVSATVFNNDTQGDWYAEVELRLRTTITPNSITGYEVLFRTRKDGSAYMNIVRWPGPRGNSLSDFTFLFDQSGSQYIVLTGDVIRATIVGNVITVYKNGAQIAQVTDSSPVTSGNPGVGFWLRNLSQTGDATTYGFSSFSATDGEADVVRHTKYIFGPLLNGTSRYKMIFSGPRIGAFYKFIFR